MPADDERAGEWRGPEALATTAPALLHRPELAEDLVGAIASPLLDPLFLRSQRTGMESAWYGHVPFAHWIVVACRPRILVELGTHNGVSYAAFCEALARFGGDSRAYAVDTWQGDEHAGHYGDEVYWDLRRFHDERFAGFSELLRCTFEDALPYFADGSVDLLHIDGFHTYEAVRGDFEAWRPKLSDQAVVLFHDTNMRERGFGVWRLWSELRERLSGLRVPARARAGRLGLRAARAGGGTRFMRADRTARGRRRARAVRVARRALGRGERAPGQYRGPAARRGRAGRGDAGARGRARERERLDAALPRRSGRQKLPAWSARPRGP